MCSFAFTRAVTIEVRKHISVFGQLLINTVQNLKFVAVRRILAKTKRSLVY